MKLMEVTMCTLRPLCHQLSGQQQTLKSRYWRQPTQIERHLKTDELAYRLTGCWSTTTSSSAIAERPRRSFGQEWKTGTWRQYFTDIIRGLYSTTVTYLASKAIEFGEKTQNKGYYAVQGHSRSFKVIEMGINRKPVCDFLLVINSNWHFISYLSELSQLIVQILDTLCFWATFWGLR